MTETKNRTRLWIAAGAVLSLLVILVTLGGLSGQVWVTDPGGIPEAADRVMTCICSNDWRTLESLAAGTPALEPMTGEENTAENRIWNAYRESLRWTCEEGFSLRGANVTQPITVTCLDISALTGMVAEILRESGVVNAGPEELSAAAEQALEQEMPVLQREITLHFCREGGEWKVIPNEALLALMSGFTNP
ncbi:MAG: hypothetical protein IJD98_02875 [Oscillospiraceae bacterium]|nr:hypothetical protein [Oscillospiraceae bacterium]